MPARPHLRSCRGLAGVAAAERDFDQVAVSNRFHPEEFDQALGRVAIALVRRLQDRSVGAERIERGAGGCKVVDFEYLLLHEVAVIGI